MITTWIRYIEREVLTEDALRREAREAADYEEALADRRWRSWYNRTHPLPAPTATQTIHLERPGAAGTITLEIPCP